MLSIEAVTLHYGSHVALRDVSVSIEPGEIMALLGPSGSGKSSLLRVVAGLEKASSGDVQLDGTSLLATPVHKRNVGLMFQDYALFPHLSVADNVAFGLRVRGDADTATRVAEVLTWVGLRDVSDRSVDSLSGGEQQRVALARCLAPDPSIVMLDEPVGSLDRALRARLVPEIATVLRRLNVPAIFVTHDQDEAFAIADRIGIIDKGQIRQVDSPRDLWRSPANELVARFLGFDNIADVRIAGGVATTPWGAVSSDLGDGDWRVTVRPDRVAISDAGELVGNVIATTFVGGHHRVVVHCLYADIVTHTVTEPPPIGSSVRVALAADALHPLSDA